MTKSLKTFPWLVLLLWAGPVLGCTFNFGFLAGDGEPSLPLIVETYGRLLDTAGARVTPELLEKMAAGENPFALPAAEANELDALAKHLREYDRLLTVREWSSEATRAALKGDLRRRAEATRQTAVARQSKADGLRRPYSITLPNTFPYGARLSPDGRFLVNFERPPATLNVTMPSAIAVRVGPPTAIVVHELATGKQTRQEFPYVQPKQLEFAADGKHLLLAGPGTLYRIPFHDGKIDFAASKSAGEILENQDHLRVVDSANVDRAYLAGGNRTRRHFYVMDFLTGKRTELEIPPTQGHDTNQNTLVRDWGRVPGTDKLWFLVADAKRDPPTVHFYTVDADGKAVPAEPKPRKLPERAMAGFSNLHWFPDGKRFAVSNGDETDLYDGIEAEPVTIPRIGRKSTWRLLYKDVAPIPGKNELLAVMSDDFNEYLVVIDLESKLPVGKLDLASTMNRSLRLTQDGSSVILNQHDGELRVFPIEAVRMQGNEPE